MYNNLKVLADELDLSIQMAMGIAAQADEAHERAVAKYERSQTREAYQDAQDALSWRGRCATIVKDLETARNRARIQMSILEQKNYETAKARAEAAGRRLAA